LVHGDRALCDQDNLHEELGIFRQIGYTDGQIHRASVAFLPYVRSIFNCISRVLSQHNIKFVDLPPRKISSFLWSVKDDLKLKMLGVYSIPYGCGQVYIW
jgi:Na+-transporting NADH:ubiquinone oxidoreductase subunit NqrF